MFDHDYLLGLAATYLSENSEEDSKHGKRRSEMATVLNRLHEEKTNIARKQAKAGNLDYLEDAVAEIEQEETALRALLHDLDRRKQLRLDQATVEDQLVALADRAEEKLSKLTTNEPAEFFDLIQLDLERVGDYKFVGNASIPIPLDGGEVWGGSRHRSI